MKIAFFALNQNFCGSILEELQAKHTVRNFKPSGVKAHDYANMTGLINWCDIIYCDFIQSPMPEITQLQFLEKPLVARMDGIDILNHVSVDWRKVSALVLMPVQKKRLGRLRWMWEAENKKKLSPLPKRILERNIGIDLSLFQPNYQRPPGYQIVLHATVIRDTKGVYEALQCFKRLIEEDEKNPWQLTIIGQWEGGYQWPERQEYVMSCQELIEDLNFPPGRLGVIRGNLSREKWAEYLKDQADFYWCFSKREGFPNSLGEACASGIIPVINRFYGAELIYPAETLSRSPSEIVEKTLSIGELPAEEKQRLRQQARKHIEQYDQHKTAVEIRELCEEIFSEWQQKAK